MQATTERTSSLQTIILTILTLGIASLSGCGGDVSLRPQEAVTPGEALGFDFIAYVATSPDPDGGELDTIQETLAIEPDGRTSYRRDTIDEQVRQPDRFLLDEALLDVRRKFSASRFPTYADSIYGDPAGDARRFKESIVYQVDGETAQIIRYDQVPVPPEIQVLFDQLGALTGQIARFGRGEAVPVTPMFTGETTRVDVRDFVVIRSQDALLSLLWRIGSIEISVLPRVDFSREMIVGVFLGEDAFVGLDREDRNLAVAFDETAFVHEGSVQVRFLRTEAADGCPVPRGNRPFTLARIPRSDYAVEFYEDSEVQLRQCQEEDVEG